MTGGIIKPSFDDLMVTIHNEIAVKVRSLAVNGSVMTVIHIAVTFSQTNTCAMLMERIPENV